MKIYTSYFYQIRNFPKNLIPLSTAVWDPKWYHNNNSLKYVYRDKRGIFVGLRAEMFAPDGTCQDLCRGPDRPDICYQEGGRYGCSFLNTYRRQLDKLDFNETIEGLKELSRSIQELEHSDEEYDIALIFHEIPDNPCSERRVVQDWFKDHGITAEEFA